MTDLSRLRSVEDIAAARAQLTKQAQQQSVAVQKDVNAIRSDINRVMGRIRRVENAFASLFSVFSPVSALASGLGRTAWLLPLVRAVFRRFRRKK